MTLAATTPLAAQQIDIALDSSDSGLVFEGIGALSAGASSRLLIEYPEPQRSQILDYLFLPKYGASIQHLKVEIGGNINSTCGVERSHMDSRTEENYQRGYEWWLMKEAKKRNPDIILDCLAWGAPGWIGNGSFFSQDMADYVVKFIKGAKTYHDLDFDYTGIWNERPYQTEWIKLLRQTLDANGLGGVKIVAADGFDWAIVDQSNADPALKAAIDVAGVHYTRSTSTDAAKNFGKPLWASEDGPWSGKWKSDRNGAMLQRLYNRNYIVGRMTKTIIWSPVTSYFDYLPLPASGLIQANTPWSGHYQVEPALWVTAHTTQFAGPGWMYLDGACQILPGVGSIVTLKSPVGNHFSAIIETSDAGIPATINFTITGGLSTGSIGVWKSSASAQFEQLANIEPIAGAFSITLEPDCVYSLTTTTGQQRGDAVPLPAQSFPQTYFDEFSAYGIGATPRLWSDFAGVFEVVARADGNGAALRQTRTARGIEWLGDTEPVTVLGEPQWDDYSFSALCLAESNGYTGVYGRIGSIPEGGYRDTLPGYLLLVNTAGTWELRAKNTVLASGNGSFPANTWHRLKLTFNGNRITAIIDGTKVATVTDSTYAAGGAGLACGWHAAQFDETEIQRATATDPSRTDLALAGSASASSQWSPKYAAANANDGDPVTRWNSIVNSSTGEWIEITFAAPQKFNRVTLRQFEDRITQYAIQYDVDGSWQNAFEGGPMAAESGESKITFPAVTSARVRLLVLQTKLNATPSIFQFAIQLAEDVFKDVFTLAGWQSAWFSPAELADPNISGPTATPAGDGVNNLLKYALGLPPKVPASTSQHLGVFPSGDTFAFIYTKPAGRLDLTCTAEASTSLQSSSWFSEGLERNLVSVENGIETWSITCPTAVDLNRLFWRLRINEE